MATRAWSWPSVARWIDDRKTRPDITRQEVNAWIKAEKGNYEENFAKVITEDRGAERRVNLLVEIFLTGGQREWDSADALSAAKATIVKLTGRPLVPKLV